MPAEPRLETTASAVKTQRKRRRLLRKKLFLSSLLFGGVLGRRCFVIKPLRGSFSTPAAQKFSQFFLSLSFPLTVGQTLT
jgi:hypothetical protein